MKICYLIQTHTNPEQIYRLVKVIKQLSPESYVLICHNFNSCYLDKAPLENLSDVEIIVSSKVERYDFSLVQAYFNAIDWIFKHNIEFDWLINLTGQDYLTQPLSKMEKLLNETKYDGFLEYYDVLSSASPWGVKRGYERYYYQYLLSRVYISRRQKLMFKPIKDMVNNFQKIVRIDGSPVVMIGCKSDIAPFNDTFKCYGGSYFSTLSRQCINYLYNYFNQNSDIINYYKNTLLPEESLIQTVLVNSGIFSLCNHNHRYINFKNSRLGHPRLLMVEDYPILTKENIYFARKFDMTIDSKILDLLDQKIFTLSKV